MIACMCFGSLEIIYGLFLAVTGGFAALAKWRNSKNCKCHGKQEGMLPSQGATNGGGLHM